ncbi:hypothetical protein EXS54_00195 [Patescibacteria group bacterium]|nr:hypothetical protein [Patescibacteria group bacterium]
MSIEKPKTDPELLDLFRIRYGIPTATERAEQEMAERAKTTPDQRYHAATNIMRAVQLNTLYAEASDEDIEREHDIQQAHTSLASEQVVHKQGEETKGHDQSRWSFGVIEFVHEEIKLNAEQTIPMLNSLINEGFIERAPDFRGLLLTDDGKELVMDMREFLSKSKFKDRLPWREEGWEA